MVDLNAYLRVLDDRPHKLNADQVEYEPAPEGSVMRCAACLHYFRRAIDSFATCEIFRDEQTDREGVRPDFRCAFYNIDGQVFPLLDVAEEDEVEATSEEEDIPY